MQLIDLSPPVSSLAPHWPGDHGFTSEARWRIESGEPVNVSTITTTGHIGSHVDAPSHVVAGGATSETISLQACIGPCVVVNVEPHIEKGSSPHGFAPAEAILAKLQVILGTDLQLTPQAPLQPHHSPIERILLRHRASSDGWYEKSPGLDPDFVRWFGEQGGRLIGVDLDSFDALQSKRLPAHRAAVAADIVMVEGLDLSNAPETTAELIALPAHWVGVDAVPLRAVLRV